MMLTPQQFVDGTFLLINKPKGWTSFDVIAKIRGPLQRFTDNKKLKIGHTGTLDPMATGLLVIATGKFTKKINELQELDKTYTGTIRLGAVTPSYDADTPVQENFEFEHVTEEMIMHAIKSFMGEIDQVPPVYSSIKIEGERAYKKARTGEEVVMKSRKVTIHDFEITGIHLPDIQFRISSSKGTYIRSIAHDLGKALGCGGHLTELTRTKVGNFDLADATTIEEFLKQINPPASS